MGEQSPLAVRGQSMQDVIFAGAHGVQARAEAEVEVVLDNASGGLDLPVGEVSILRRLNRAGEGEYRINGAKCRLVDVIEILSDTGLGKEMHSVVSQGRVEAIVTSKPRDRRMLIEEAAGLGKHRKRRRRAQLKLERTQDNLDRALDVEREARTRLKPLEAPGRGRRAARADRAPERRGALDAGARRRALGPRGAGGRRGGGGGGARRRGGDRGRAGGRRRAPRGGRGGAVRARLRAREPVVALLLGALVGRADRRCAWTPPQRTAAELAERAARRRASIERLEAEAEADTGDDGAAERIAALQAELAELAEDYRTRLERELAELEARREAATALLAERTGGSPAPRPRAAPRARPPPRPPAAPAASSTTPPRRPAASPPASAPSWPRSTSSCAPTPAPRAAPRRSPTSLSAAPGYELALAAALGPRLRAAVAADLAAGAALLSKAGKDGAAALIVPTRPRRTASRSGSPRADAASPAPPTRPRAPGRRRRVRRRCRSPVPPPRRRCRSRAPLVPGLDVVPGRRDARAAAPRLAAASSPPAPGAEPLSAHVRATGDAAASGSPPRCSPTSGSSSPSTGSIPRFRGVAVTKDGRVWSPGTRELRQVSPGGADRVLAERNRRDALVEQVEVAAQAERAAQAEVEAAQAKVAEADAARDAIDREARAAARARDEAAEAERHARWVIQQRRAAPDEGPSAERRAQVESAIKTEQRLAERAERERAERARRLEHERRRLERDQALKPVADRLAAALDAAGAAISTRVEVLEAELAADRAAGEKLDRRAARVRRRGVARPRPPQAARRGGHPRRGPRAAGARPRAGRRDRARRASPRSSASRPSRPRSRSPSSERATLLTRIERLQRRREQLGPVNPLAQQEYKEALEHVEELERQREDLETALRELAGPDPRHRPAHQGGLRGDLQRRGQELRGGRRAPLPGRPRQPAARPRGLRPAPRARRRRGRGGGRRGADEDEDESPEDKLGVEIEITPAGKSTKRLTLLSGGEKSMTALAFLFAVFLARPCPFYILDEVEAALDDLNIDRFLKVLRSFSGRAQFIVVTHQKRTMEAADSLYGVSMAGNGVSKVISRRLPRAVEDEAA